MRVVLDTNVVASAILWGGTPRLLLNAAREKRIDLFTSTLLLAELTDILGRSKFDTKIAASGLTVDEIVYGYARLASVVQPFTVPRIAPDPNDDMVLGTALAARAFAIVTGDKALLTVGEHEGIRLLTVAQAIDTIAAGTSG